MPSQTYSFIIIGHRICAYYIFRRWVFLFIYFFFQSPSRLDLTSDCHNQYQYRKVVEVAVITVSQYSTVVLTVVRVMIAKYRKSGIWGYRISLTPEPIELK